MGSQIHREGGLGREVDLLLGELVVDVAAGEAGDVSCGQSLAQDTGELRPPGLWLVSVPVHVQQPQPGGLQALHRDLGEALHQLVSEAGVLVALLPQAHPI